MIGAGVIGLSTAVCLAERGQRKVRTRLVPAQATSALASAMVGPAMAPAGTDAARRERTSIEAFEALAGVGGAGVDDSPWPLGQPAVRAHAAG